MRITVVGSGYVGLVTGACFAEMGTQVTCVDIDKQKIADLKSGKMPIFEPGLDELVAKNMREGRLSFSTSLADSLGGVDIVFSAVGTPSDEDGSADLSYVLQVARAVGRSVQGYFVLVTKSTVPVGTAAKVKLAVQEELDRRGVDFDFDVASNPEFLKEGAAIKDFMSPDRIVVGTESQKARELLEKLYKPFMLNGERFIFMDVASAEMTKYAANAMLATRISFINEIAALCEKVGADAELVRRGIGSDPRIGNKFIYPGAGYGGSCFPKDLRALIHTGREHNCPMSIVETVDRVNEVQKMVLYDKLKNAMGEVKGKTIAVWGVAFKPNTDDIRLSPALTLIEEVLKNGAKVKLFDPVAMDNTRQVLGDRVEYSLDKYDAICGADAVVLVTEWRQFRLPDWGVIKERMVGNVVVDGRNIFDEGELRGLGFRYHRIGKRA